MKTTIVLIVSLFFSFGSFAQQSPAFNNQDLGKAYTHYIDIKEALVNSNAQKASEAAVQLKKTLANVESSEAARDAATDLNTAGGLKEQRKAFAGLTTEMSKLIKGGKLSSGEIYMEFCPMANNGAGGYWLSNEKEIRNPFMGEKMIGCGMVKETIQ